MREGQKPEPTSESERPTLRKLKKKSEFEWLTDPARYWSVQDLPGTGWQILGVVGILISVLPLIGAINSSSGYYYNPSGNAFLEIAAVVKQSGAEQTGLIYWLLFAFVFSTSLGLIAVGSIIKTIHHCASQLIPRSPCHVCHKPFPTADLHRLDSGQLICPECRSEMKT